jgi:PKD repeat protein
MKRFLLLAGCIINIMLIGSCSGEKYNFDDLPRAVKSYFTISNVELNINEAIVFKNESEDATTYLWDFGDGTTSSEANPSKIYTAPGMYTVKLKAIGDGGTGNYSQDIAVVDPNAVIETDNELYFIEYNSDLIRKLSLIPGSNVETVANMSGKGGHGMTYDPINNKIYFCDFENTNNGKILRMNLDGTNIEEVLTGLGSPYGVAINHAEGKMYIADGANVSRANLDGSGFEKQFVNISGGAMRAIGFSTKTNLIYFYEVNDEYMYVAKPDGTGVEQLIEGAYGYGLYIDDVNEKIYYDDRNNAGLMRANLDGTNPVKIASFSGNRGGSGMAVDHDENKIYWSETNLGNIKRANLDGTEPETVRSGLSNPRGMFIKH